MKKLLNNQLSIFLLTFITLATLSGCSINEKYTVTWQNYDGTTLEVDEEVSAGSMPSYDGETPTLNADDQYTYDKFAGWSPIISKVSADQVYTAQYKKTVKTYTITWKNYDGTILEVDENVPYGTTPTYDGDTPTKTANAQYSYAFSNWSPEVTSVTGNATYTAQFNSTVNTYTITWKNYDGTILEVDENVPYGTTPTYDGDTPTQTADVQYTFGQFIGWSPLVSEVIWNQTYVARYEKTLNSYTITWKNYDGTILEVDNNVPYGSIPTYNGLTPNHEDQAYFFSSWSPSVSEVVGNQTYAARFVTEGGVHTFGTYPQSKVTDTTLLSTLNAAGGTLPTSANSQAWTDYGYYISGYVSSYMWYIDITNETDEYRGVYFTSYRPYYTGGLSSTSNSHQDDNGYTTSSVYWFKYEPITWRVLDVQSSSAFLMADLVLDSQDYHYSQSSRTIGGSTVYANNYEHSHIRSWLNDTFYNTAFNAAEKARILTTTVDNSVASTGYSTNQYACANTSDKVFLLSYAEATSATYGLNTDASRQLQPSAYAQSQGVYTYTSNGNSYWWLRSPHDYYTVTARDVDYDGDVDFNNIAITYYGVVPALWISL
ncbi:MAG: DUF6273 domain-containing protein [Bacilli bacterium]|nr:DUF6273 domain-containing protein [Bacilli bacterium]